MRGADREFLFSGMSCRIGTRHRQLPPRKNGQAFGKVVEAAGVVPGATTAGRRSKPGRGADNTSERERGSGGGGGSRTARRPAASTIRPKSNRSTLQNRSKRRLEVHNRYSSSVALRLLDEA